MNKKKCCALILSCYVLDEIARHEISSTREIPISRKIPYRREIPSPRERLSHRERLSPREIPSRREILPVSRRQRRVWVKEWVKKREEDGFCTKLMRQLEDQEPALYTHFVRITQEQFSYLCALVTPLVEKKNTSMRKSIATADRLILTLRFLATGESFRSLQYIFRIPQSTISTIIPEMLEAIYKVLAEEYIQTPCTPEGWEIIARQYNDLWNYPNCIGAVDGKHVVMIEPPSAGSVFYNYRGTHSIVLLGIADADYKLTYFDVDQTGRCSESGIFNTCSFASNLDNGLLGLPPPKPLPGRELPVPYVLVADDTFALRTNLMKPYAHSEDMVDQVHNFRLSRARSVIENVFGLISARFGVLRKPIALNPEKTKRITLACCALHNYLITTNRQRYAPAQSYDSYTAEGELIPGEWRKEPPNGTFFSLAELNDTLHVPHAKEIQKEFADYFVNEGELDWQYQIMT